MPRLVRVIGGLGACAQLASTASIWIVADNVPRISPEPINLEQATHSSLLKSRTRGKESRTHRYEDSQEQVANRRGPENKLASGPTFPPCSLVLPSTGAMWDGVSRLSISTTVLTFLLPHASFKSRPKHIQPLQRPSSRGFERTRFRRQMNNSPS